MLKQPDEIRGAYSRTETAEEYIDQRFASARGAVMHAAQVKVLNEVIRQYQVKRVLEIAPGPARLSRDLSGFDRGYLCEFNESMIEVARRRLRNANGRWHIVRGDAFHLPIQPRRGFDLVYTFRFIRHFQTAARTALYRQISSVLKDDGLFVFDAVNAKGGLRGRMPSADGLDIYDELYRPDTLERELVANGFTPISLTDVLRHMLIQHQIQVLVAPRSYGLARRLISLLELVPGDPLEWIVVCRKHA